MADITEQQDVAREISEAISRSTGEEFDEVDTFSTPCQRLFNGQHALSIFLFVFISFLFSFDTGTQCVCVYEAKKGL